MRTRSLVCLWLLIGAVVASCGGPTSAASRPVVVVSVPPQAYLVEQLAGDAVDVHVLIPPGASPATHEPSVREVSALASASLLILVGHPRFPFEAAWGEKLTADRPDLPVVSSSAGVPVRPEDPHVWVSPRAMRTMATNVHAGLVELLPERASDLGARLSTFLASVDRLEAELESALAPARGRRVLVFHPAWGYLLADYEIHQLAIESEGKEPGPAELQRVIQRARDAQVSVVFVQPQFSTRAAETVARELDIPVVELDPLARDWDANLRRVATTFRGALR